MTPKAVGVPSIADGLDPVEHSVRWATNNAHASWYCLEKILLRVPSELEPAALLAIVRARRSDVIEIFLRRPAFGKLLQDIHLQGLTPTFEKIYLRHAGFLTIIATFFAALAEECNALQDIRSRTHASLGRTLDVLLSLVKPQVEALARLLVAAEDACATLGASRIALLEFPVGNSIPTRLLRGALEARGVVATIHTACLSRNDRAWRGPKREDLLNRQLHELGPSQHDLYVYCDEWMTGTNFDRLSGFLQRIAERNGARLLPIGLLAVEAATHVRYPTFIKRHAKHIERLNVRSHHPLESSAFRIPVPEVRTLSKPFFWSEDDRLSGYRKYQLLGSLVSGIDAATKLLFDDPEELDKALFLSLTQLASIGMHVRPHELGDLFAHREAYRSSYQSYVSDVRDRLLAAEHPTNTDPFADYLTAEPAIGELIDRVAKGTSAYHALFIACAYIAQTHAYDLSERYLIDTHTPMCRLLSGPAAELHMMLMERLSRLGG